MISNGKKERQRNTPMGNEGRTADWNTVAVASANTTKVRAPTAMRTSARVCFLNGDCAGGSSGDETKASRMDCPHREGTSPEEEQESNPRDDRVTRRAEDCWTDVGRATREGWRESLWIWTSRISLWRKIRTREASRAASMETAVEGWNWTRRRNFLPFWLSSWNSRDPLEWMWAEVAQLCDCLWSVSLESTGVDWRKSCCLRSSLDWRCDWNSYHLFRRRRHFSRESSLPRSSSSRRRHWHWSMRTMEHRCHCRAAACRSSSKFHRLSRAVLRESWRNCSCWPQWALLLRKVLDVCRCVEFSLSAHAMSGCYSLATEPLRGTRSLPLINNHGWNYDDDCVDYVCSDEYRIYTLRRKKERKTSIIYNRQSDRSFEDFLIEISFLPSLVRSFVGPFSRKVLCSSETKSELE